MRKPFVHSNVSGDLVSAHGFCQTSHKGFTLIELMIVVAIIGVLAAIAVPNLISMRNRALEASVKANMHSVHLAVEEFATMADGVYPGDLDTRIDQVSTNPNNKSLAAGARKPPFPVDALLRAQGGFKNPFSGVVNVVDNLLIGYPPVAVPPHGCTYYSSYQQDHLTPSGPGQPASYYNITAYGADQPILLILGPQ